MRVMLLRDKNGLPELTWKCTEPHSKQWVATALTKLGTYFKDMQVTIDM